MQNKLIAAGVGLVGYGALWGWALTADRYEQKLNELSGRIDDLESLNGFLRSRPLGLITNVYNDSNDSMGMHVEGRLTDPGQEDVLVSPEPIEDLTEKSEIENSPEENADEKSGEWTEVEVETPDESPEATRENLQALINQYTANPDDVDTFVNSARRTAAGAEQKPPFVISQNQFSWDEDEGDDYAKITVTYYPRNRIVLDDDEEPMDDVGSILGWRNLSRFGDESGDADVVFIRNRRMMTDFEVVRDEENELPLHVKYGMGKEEFQVNKAAGTLRLREEDQ